MIGGLTNATPTQTVIGPTLDITGLNGQFESSSFTINTGATLLIDNGTSGNRTARIPTTSTIVLNGGTLIYSGSSTGASLDTIGTISLASGNSTIQLNQNGSGSTTLVAAALARSVGATVLFTYGGAATSFGNGTNELLTAVSTTLASGNFLSGAVVNTSTGLDFATQAAGTNQPITAFGGVAGTNFSTNINAPVSSGVFKLTSSQTMTAAPATFNALLLSGSNINLSGSSSTPTLVYTGTSGGPEIVTSNAGSATNDTISIPTITVNSADEVQTLTFTGSPTGGTYQLVFGQGTTSAITYSATATTEITNIQTALNGLFGTGNTFVSVNTAGGYTITFLNPSNGITAPTAINAFAPAGGSASVAITVTGSAAEEATVIDDKQATLNMGSVINGAGGLTVGGSGTLALNGTNGNAVQNRPSAARPPAARSSWRTSLISVASHHGDHVQHHRGN